MHSVGHSTICVICRIYLKWVKQSNVLHIHHLMCLITAEVKCLFQHLVRRLAYDEN